ncbi:MULTISPECIES: glutathione S-transferase family protein [unclassified Pusillimonas]|uniref:glutathione S-transferase family protein n=1 Tax=unclassified Pusillimonas TaxID=2640016 RepID=UPI000B946553|nr:MULTISPECIES: glutathione S-transferase family protein [unclassified Pusillimonas]OXR49363.1 glutathione S-transferase [Pusillimonas sp. T2]ROT45275.1 glutathione S-transferase family protein [Pusillimonas sp. NJUB218]
MKLYYLPGACPLATQIVLEWMKLPYELQAVSRDELKQPAFLALNPIGSVPVFQDGDFTLTQSVAIVEYLTDLHPESGLHGSDARERAEVRRWLNFCNSDLHRTFSLVFAPQNFSADEAGKNVLVSKATERVQFLFGVADKQLEGKDYLTGKKSIADPYLFTIMTWAKFKQVDLSAYKNLARFFDVMANDPAVQQAQKRQQEG